MEVSIWVPLQRKLVCYLTLPRMQDMRWIQLQYWQLFKLQTSFYQGQLSFLWNLGLAWIQLD
ncbi:UNKNOWN [Stylonychia lemnae]|uniref:Uncharacterized protein n=1 Tax=Stylonychia lemnae TaxID=5949 RepID=A0A078AMN0_STYLE|nr:UNKNOWN [Stylonychia lemnae]|eukprot:CDW83171.1 UNKNOWN [Stylonychia lemnae]